MTFLGLGWKERPSANATANAGFIRCAQDDKHFCVVKYQGMIAAGV